MKTQTFGRYGYYYHCDQFAPQDHAAMCHGSSRYTPGSPPLQDREASEAYLAERSNGTDYDSPKTPFPRFLPDLFYLLDKVFYVLPAEGLRPLCIGMTRIASYLKIIQYPTSPFFTVLIWQRWPHLFNPLPQRGRGSVLERGASPLFNSPFIVFIGCASF